MKWPGPRVYILYIHKDAHESQLGQSELTEGQGVGMVRAEVNRGELLTSRTERAYRGEYTAALKVQTG